MRGLPLNSRRVLYGSLLLYSRLSWAAGHFASTVECDTELEQHTVCCISNRIHFPKLIFTLHLEIHLLVDQDRPEVYVKIPRTVWTCREMGKGEERGLERWLSS